MSLEQAIVELTAAVQANTAALLATPAKATAAKATRKTSATPSESAPAPAAESQAPVAPATASAPPAAAATAPAQPAATAKEPTLDDVRNALVQCQTRKGSKDVPMGILAKYAPTKTTGSLPKDKYAAVIAECGAA